MNQIQEYILNLAKNHYWDSLQCHKDMIILHLHDIIALLEIEDDLDDLAADNARLTKEVYLLPFYKARMEREIARQIELTAEKEKLNCILEERAAAGMKAMGFEQAEPEPTEFNIFNYEPTHSKIHSYVSACDGDITKEEARELLIRSHAKKEIDRLTCELSTERLIAECYRRVCSSLGIEKDILGYVKAQAEEIEQLKERDKFLTALECAGVDNWEGYSEAMQILKDDK